MCKITIAIPTCDRKEYLTESIQSILNQTFQDFKIIIFDNASNFDIEGLIGKFNCDKIFLIKNEKNIGGSENFRKIFNYVFDTDFIMIFHDDDTLHPNYLEKAIEALDKDSDLVWVGSELNFIKEKNKMFLFKKIINLDIMVCDTENLIKKLFNDFDLCFDSVIYRNSFPFEVKEIQKEFGKWADRPTLIELSKRGKVGIFDFPFVNYRIHPFQDSQIFSDNDLLKKLKNLYIYYRNNFLTKKDNEKTFLIWSTNFLILNLSNFVKDFPGYLGLLKNFKEDGLFNVKYIRFRGFYYFLCVIKKYVFSCISKNIKV